MRRSVSTADRANPCAIFSVRKFNFDLLSFRTYFRTENKSQKKIRTSNRLIKLMKICSNWSFYSKLLWCVSRLQNNTRFKAGVVCDKKEITYLYFVEVYGRLFWHLDLQKTFFPLPSFAPHPTRAKQTMLSCVCV